MLSKLKERKVDKQTLCDKRDNNTFLKQIFLQKT